MKPLCQNLATKKNKNFFLKRKKMSLKKFVYKSSIRLRDTDATGVLYFADQFKIALEAFEAFLMASGLSLKGILADSDFLIPIVHAESDYFAPLTVGDEIDIALTIPHVGTSSFTCSYELFDSSRKIIVGKTSLVHVAMSRKTKKSIPIPNELKKIIS